MAHETYGAHLRNLLGQYQFLVSVINEWLSGNIKDEQLKQFLKSSDTDLQDGVNKIIEFSKQGEMENINWR